MSLWIYFRLPVKRFDTKWADGVYCVPLLLILLVLTTAILIFEVLVSRTVESRWSTWEAFGPCSVTCGDGTKTRWRLCKGGPCFGPGNEVQTCNLRPCQPVYDDDQDEYYDEGEWNDWSSWSNCSAACDDKGVRERYRTCLETSDDGFEKATTCEGLSRETIECLEPCRTENDQLTFSQTYQITTPVDLKAINGQWGEWSKFTECHPSCGEGEQVRVRSCNNPLPANNGSFCNGSEAETRRCYSRDCVSWSEWSNYTSCSVSCGNGTQTKSRQCIVHLNSTLQSNCTGPSFEEISCFLMDCPIFWSEWSNYTSCSSSCGNGTQTRSRECMEPGNSTLQKNCSGQSLEKISCFLIDCPEYGPDCSVDNGGCSHLCIEGSKANFCSCPSGYTLDVDERTCSDVNECEGVNHCDGLCINAPGSYYCLCYKSNHYWDRKILQCVPNLKKIRSPLRARDSKEDESR